MTSAPRPLLSICVPTFNRPAELDETLRVLGHEMSALGASRAREIELIISDNCSEKVDARALVQSYADRLPCAVDVHVQPHNVGPTRNFEHCYRAAKGQYILILSDDDHLCEGALQLILDNLLATQADVLFLPFFEIPGPSDGPEVEVLPRNDFLCRTNLLSTLISSCIVRLDLIRPHLGTYLDTNMHHYHYFLQALEKGETFLLATRRILYSPYADNSGGYNWFKAFAEDFFRIVDEFPSQRVSRKVLRGIQKKMLVDRIIPTFVNTKIKGYTISHRFPLESQGRLINMVHARCSGLAAYWTLFLPLALMPPFVLRLAKVVYQAQRQHLFQWH